jgi:hypothetical protein
MMRIVTILGALLLAQDAPTQVELLPNISPGTTLDLKQVRQDAAALDRRLRSYGYEGLTVEVVDERTGRVRIRRAQDAPFSEAMRQVIGWMSWLKCETVEFYEEVSGLTRQQIEQLVEGDNSSAPKGTRWFPIMGSRDNLTGRWKYRLVKHDALATGKHLERIQHKQNGEVRWLVFAKSPKRFGTEQDPVAAYLVVDGLLVDTCGEIEQWKWHPQQGVSIIWPQIQHPMKLGLQVDGQ